MAKKPARYRVVIPGDSTVIGCELGEYTNKKVAISEAKQIIDGSRWFVWDDWEKKTAFNSWWD